MPEIKHGINVTQTIGGVRPISRTNLSTIGICGTAPDATAEFPFDTPVAITTTKQVTDLGTTGTLPAGLRGVFALIRPNVVLSRVDEGVDEAGTLANVAGVAADMTGVHAFMGAQSTVQLVPKIIIAPGWTHQRPEDGTNPVVAQIKIVITQLVAISYVDGESTSDAAAIVSAGEAGSERIELVDPFLLVFDTFAATNIPTYGSAFMAGLRAWTDHNFGIHHSTSNKTLAGVTGVARPIAFNMGDPTSQANVLNAAGVTTFIFNNGWRAWGNRGTGSDPLTQFMTVRRTMDMIEDAIENAFLWAIDKPISSQLILDIEGSLKAFIRELKATGAILGGDVWLDKELNTKETLAAGQIFVDMDVEPPAPCESLEIRISRNAGYYEEILREIAA